MLAIVLFEACCLYRTLSNPKFPVPVTCEVACEGFIQAAHDCYLGVVLQRKYSVHIKEESEGKILGLHHYSKQHIKIEVNKKQS